MRGRPPQVSEETLLDAAAEVLLRKGAAATTAQIARRAGVSEGLLFYRYATKDELVAAVIERQLRPSPALEALVRDPGDRAVPEALRDVVREVLAALRRAWPFIDVARATAGSARIARIARRSGATPARLVDLVTRHFAAEAERGRLRSVRPSVAGRLVVGVAHERALSEVSPAGDDPGDDDETFLREVVDLVLFGVAAPPAASRPAARR
jgi:AcrR family transcriptional regulator